MAALIIDLAEGGVVEFSPVPSYSSVLFRVRVFHTKLVHDDNFTILAGSYFGCLFTIHQVTVCDKNQAVSFSNEHHVQHIMVTFLQALGRLVGAH